MEIKFGITEIAREIVIDTEANTDDVVEQVRAAVAGDTLVDLTDEKGRRVLIPGRKIGYVDFGATATRPVGFGAV